MDVERANPSVIRAVRVNSKLQQSRYEYVAEHLKLIKG
jgi:hypothetical protein